MTEALQAIAPEIRARLGALRRALAPAEPATQAAALRAAVAAEPDADVLRDALEALGAAYVAEYRLTVTLNIRENEENARG